jgi:hypothetical protein
VKNYDPKRYELVFKGVQVQGYAAGTFIQVARQTETFSDDVGALGDVVRIKSHDLRGTVTITLQSTSPTNDLLSAFATVGEEGETIDGDVGDVLLKDLNGLTTASAREAWIVKKPDLDVSVEHPNRVWVIRCAKLKSHVGGALR